MHFFIVKNAYLHEHQMLMFDGPLQVLFYARPPNSQLLFSELENTALLWKIRRACRALGVHDIEKLHNTKCWCLMVPFKSCFMQDPQIPNFYLGNQETHPF